MKSKRYAVDFAACAGHAVFFLAFLSPGGPALTGVSPTISLSHCLQLLSPCVLWHSRYKRRRASGSSPSKGVHRPCCSAAAVGAGSQGLWPFTLLSGAHCMAESYSHGIGHAFRTAIPKRRTQSLLYQELSHRPPLPLHRLWGLLVAEEKRADIRLLSQVAESRIRCGLISG